MNLELNVDDVPLRCSRSQRAQAFSLVECIVYMALFAVVAGLGFVSFFHCRDNAESLRRTADDIVITLKAGERWREDVRRAVAPLQFIEGAEQQVVVPQKIDQVAYRFSKQAVWRRAGTNGSWVSLLPKVKQSRMERDARQHVTGWRWEVELKTRQPGARLRPLFTFEAVALGGTKP